jgi:murein DD-endopeptidase MepM/ murein hydrolase activator NlpD
MPKQLAIVLVLAIFCLVTISISVQAATVPLTFLLPVVPGLSVTVSQGNNDYQHDHYGLSAYAFDFIVGQSNFLITAAQSGKVLSAKDTSTIQCNDRKCWTEANFVLIENDGKLNGQTTASLYMHLLPGSLKVKIGDNVTQGQPLAQAGTTGFSTGNHLHFQVEDMPSASNIKSNSLSGLFTQSIPITFSNPEVLSQDKDGVPKSDQTFVLPAAKQTLQSSPTPDLGKKGQPPSAQLKPTVKPVPTVVPTTIPAPVPTPTPVPQEVYHMAVDSSIPPPGVDTRIALTAGEQITITAQGWVTFGSGSDPTCDTSSNAVNIRVNPDGQRETVNGVSCPPRMDQYISHPDSPVGELMAGIGSGTSQIWFAPGSSYTGTVSTNGNLYLLFNDGYYPDNTGQYQVTITVSPS